MRKEVFKDDSGRWSWSVSSSESSAVQRSGYSSYVEADEDADEEMRLRIKSADAVAYRRRHQLAMEALSTLSQRALKALAVDAHMADTSTVAEIAQALEDGKFDHGHLVVAGLKSREDILAFVESRLCELT
ncbi:MAG: hypothetical protein ACREPQ_13745 [Rhodanobacter sp.]